MAYNHGGPGHLSIGQDAAAVGMAFSLTPDDHIFGSHRSHGEILAKGFSAIRQLSDGQLLDIMNTYREGAIHRADEKGYQGTVKGLALLLLYLWGIQRNLRPRNPDSTADWVDRCMRSSRHSASIPTMPS